jgi:hypothetical protein
MSFLLSSIRDLSTRFKEPAKRVLPKSVVEAFTEWAFFEDIPRFAFKGSPEEIRQDIRSKYGYEGDLLDIYAGHTGTGIMKWHHYIPLYDRYFSRFRGKTLRFLEIGVLNGGSLQMWRDYFGEQAIIYGIDINPNCKIFDGIAGNVRIGSQIDKEFLESVVREMGGVDIVLDDGSHNMRHIPRTLEYLFPLLSNGGIYMIEDLQTAYWKATGGGYHSGRNFFRFTFDVAQDMHRWYHREKSKQAAISHECTGIHIHDAMVVFDKNKTYKPFVSQVGI